MRHRLAAAAATVAIGLLLSAGAVPSAAYADPADDKARVDRELAKAEAALETATDRAKDAIRALAEVKGRLPGAKERLAEAEGVLAASRVAADAAAEKAREARAAYEAAGDDLDAAETAVDEARDALGVSIRRAYTGVGVVALSSVLTADSPGEVVERITYLDNLTKNQKNGVDAVVQARFTAKEKENAALVAKEDADEAADRADAALAAARDAADAAASYQDELTRLYDTRDEAARVAAEEKDESLDRYEELKKESARIERLLKAAAEDERETPAGHDAGPPPSSHGARFAMPVNGWKSSDFGWRYDPYYHVWQLHAGVDLAAAGGTPIHAADAGRVVQAGWNGGYGNYTCIYHGGGMSTCYGHQSSIAVSVGQHVRAGQYIGAVGTTGASTGNHLHFEVRIDGAPVNPLGYLPGCLC